MYAVVTKVTKDRMNRGSTSNTIEALVLATVLVFARGYEPH